MFSYPSQSNPKFQPARGGYSEGLLQGLRVVVTMFPNNRTYFSCAIASSVACIGRILLVWGINWPARGTLKPYGHRWNLPYQYFSGLLPTNRPHPLRIVLQNMKSVAKSQAVLHYVRRVKFVVIGSSFLWCQCTICFSMDAAFDRPVSARTWLFLHCGINLTGIGGGIIYFAVIGEPRRPQPQEEPVGTAVLESSFGVLVAGSKIPSYLACKDGYERRNARTHARARELPCSRILARNACAASRWLAVSVLGRPRRSMGADRWGAGE